MPWMEFRVHDSAGSLQATGRARSGRVESVAGSMVHRGLVRLLDQWNGSVSVGDTLTITVYSSSPTGAQFVYDIFKGKITRVRPDGDHTLVEGASAAASLLVKSSKVRAWSNAMSSRVLRDLLGEAGVSPGSIPSAMTTKLLHVWNTEGALLAHEVSSLLYSNHPGFLAFSDYEGELLIGTRADLAKTFSLVAFPTDATMRETGPDIERVQFSMRPVCAHQAVFDPFTRLCLGTVESAVHEITPMGKAYTEIILDRTPDSAVWGYVASKAPAAVEPS